MVCDLLCFRDTSKKTICNELGATQWITQWYCVAIHVYQSKCKMIHLMQCNELGDMRWITPIALLNANNSCHYCATWWVGPDDTCDHLSPYIFLRPVLENTCKLRIWRKAQTWPIPSIVRLKLRSNTKRCFFLIIYSYSPCLIVAVYWMYPVADLNKTKAGRHWKQGLPQTRWLDADDEILDLNNCIFLSFVNYKDDNFFLFLKFSLYQIKIICVALFGFSYMQQFYKKEVTPGNAILWWNWTLPMLISTL